MNRLQRYLYSPRNIAGCVLAFGGLGLLFAGVIGTGWPLIVAGLYAAGALGWPSRPPAAAPEPAPPPEMPIEALAAHLDGLIAGAGSRLPEAALASLQGIRATLDDLLPRLAALEYSSALSVEDSFEVQETLRRYLPDLLDGYLRLPPSFATGQPLDDGRTAAQTLSDQLALLDESIRQIAHEAYEGDAEALVASGRTLERKFRARAAYQPQ